MAPAPSSRLALAAVVLLAVGCTAPAFISATQSRAAAGEPGAVLLRGSAPTTVTGVRDANASSGTVGLASLGLVALALCASAEARQRRQPVVPRHFFGSGNPSVPPPPPSKPTSYKDFNDPWLGGADLGFDPLNLAVQGGIFDTAATAVPETTYYNYRESEVKHGRFAMTAFLAIFAESADRGALFKQLGSAKAEDMLDGTLGLDEVQLPVLLIGLGYQALAEYNLQRDETDGNILSVEYKKDRVPGNLGFDPLGFGKNGDIVGLHNFEVNMGRFAMIGVTSFLFREFVAKDPEVAAKIL